MIINGKEYPIVIERKRIKNIYFRINEAGQIYVTCPKYVTDHEISKMLQNNRQSLEKMASKMERKLNTQDEIWYLGKKYNYVYYKKVMFEDDIAFGPSVESINEYLYKNALPIFQKRLDIYAPTFDHLPKFRLRIRKMKTRWGVCNKGSMTVTLNSYLIHRDFNAIDYVICHELSHFAHMDHSASFWQEVEKHYPNYKQARKELKY